MEQKINPKSKKNIIFIGMMGAGKTTVGNELARILGKDFLDTDSLYEEKYGLISATFASDGEAVFRKREGELLEEISRNEGAVIATGGGAILHKSFDILKKTGTVIFLRATAETLYNRIGTDKTRPLSGGLESLKSIMLSRQSAYESNADIIIDTDNQTVSEILHSLL